MLLNDTLIRVVDVIVPTVVATAAAVALVGQFQT